jgi:hypothetical protein
MLYIQYIIFFLFAVFVPGYSMAVTKSQYMGAYFIYLGYAVISFIFELLLLILMQIRIKDKKSFSITIWIVMKIVTGQLNRFGTFSSVGFVIFLYW